MSLSHTLRTYNVGQLLKDPTFKRKICEISRQCTGGGSSSSEGLQQVTTQSNITSNAIQITGFNNPDFTQDGLILGFIPEGGVQIIGTTNNGINTNALALGVDGGIYIGSTQAYNISSGGSDHVYLFKYGPVLSRVSGADGVQPNDFVTLQQVENMGSITPNVVTSSDGVTLLQGTYYTYTGSSAPTWILPPVSSGVGTRIGILNDSAFDITINSNSGANDIVDSGSKTNTTTIVAGAAKIIYNNSINWFFIT